LNIENSLKPKDGELKDCHKKKTLRVKIESCTFSFNDRFNQHGCVSPDRKSLARNITATTIQHIVALIN